MPPQRRRETDLEQSVTAIQSLIATFKMERLFYLAIATVSVVVLVALAVVEFGRDQEGSWKVFALFAPAGSIVYMGNRILAMWKDALEFLSPIMENEHRNHHGKGDVPQQHPEV